LLNPSYTLIILIKKRRKMPLFVTTIHKALHQGLQESYGPSHNIFAHMFVMSSRKLSLIGDFEIFLCAVVLNSPNYKKKKSNFSCEL
jgi:hypothetical protein